MDEVSKSWLASMRLLFCIHILLRHHHLILRACTLKFEPFPSMGCESAPHFMHLFRPLWHVRPILSFMVRAFLVMAQMSILSFRDDVS